MNQGTLVTLTGPSGSGKTTIAQLLTLLRPEEFVEAVSTTTRAPRLGEEEDVNYYYVSDRVFQSRSENGFFLEEVEYNGTRYGIEFPEISLRTESGRHTILVVEPVGARQIRERYDGGKLLQIFVSAKEDDLAGWMLARGDKPTVVQNRLECDRTAIRQDAFDWDLVIENDQTLVHLVRKVVEAIRTF